MVGEDGAEVEEVVGSLESSTIASTTTTITTSSKRGLEGRRRGCRSKRCGWVSAVLHHLVVRHTAQLEEMLLIV